MGIRFKIAVGIGLIAGLVYSQAVDEYQMKAAYILNFARFVEWPEESFRGAGAPIGICVLGESSIRGVLEEAVNGKSIDGRKLVVEQVSDLRPENGCHILFVSSSACRRWRLVRANIKTPGILVVGETDGFASEGGIINLKLDRGRLHMEINAETAGQEKLRISSKLLNLAQIVR
jgi:hypothetical protein